jgi:metal-responsive CopG/Arc/MetJ family transcriptional regulator
MNLVGKILVVALTVMALVFSSFTLAVHATHKNWKLMVSNTDTTKGLPLGLTQVIAERDTAISRLLVDNAAKEQLVYRNQRESEQIRGQLESLVSELQKNNRNLKDEIDLKSGELTLAINASANSTNVLAKTQTENKDIRTENVQVKTERDQAFDNVVTTGDKLAQASGEWARLSERNKQLLAQLAQYRQVMQDRGLPLNLEKPTVTGKVTQTHTATKMVQINLGSDDGLKKGDTMDVVRVGNTAGTYLGKIRLITVDKTEAVGAAIPGTLKGTIQKDDQVTTELELQ